MRPYPPKTGTLQPQGKGHGWQRKKPSKGQSSIFGKPQLRTILTHHYKGKLHATRARQLYKLSAINEKIVRND